MEKQLALLEQKILADQMMANHKINKPEYRVKQPITPEEKVMTNAVAEIKSKTKSKRRATIGMSRQDWKQVAFKMPADIYKALDDILRATPEHTLSSWTLSAVREKMRKDRSLSAVEVD